ncbi:MAG: RNA polymerase sigma factor [Myxococcota bacterium]
MTALNPPATITRRRIPVAPGIAKPAGPYSRPGCDDPGLDALVDRYAHRVGYFARRVERRFGLDVSGRDDLESAGYWGLLKALKNRRSDAHERELSAYVSRRVEGAVIDEARGVLRRASSHTQCDPDELETELCCEWSAGDGLAGWAAADPEALADLQGRWETIEAAFEHLEQEHKNLLMAYASGRSLAEIARSAGSSPAHLQNQMTRIARVVRAQSPELRRLLRFEI